MLSEEGFAQVESAKGRSSVADLYKPGRRCGVYVLLFSDGQSYIGQSVDVVRRYTQHIRVHRDVEAIGFRELLPAELDAVEQDLIRLAERSGHKLRNITFSALPPVMSDFDLVMAVQAQERWLSGQNLIETEDIRIVNPDLREKYASKYRRFRTYVGTDTVVSKLRRYIGVAIPAIKRAEVSFWAVTCLPAYNNPDITLFLRVNLYRQEVLTIYRALDAGVDYVSLHVARGPIEQDASLGCAFPDLEISEHAYQPGGHDQLNLVIPCEELDDLMDRESVRVAVRMFNHRLMKKGPCLFSRFHCLDLADEIVKGPGEIP